MVVLVALLGGLVEQNALMQNPQTQNQQNGRLGERCVCSLCFQALGKFKMIALEVKVVV